MEKAAVMLLLRQLSLTSYCQPLLNYWLTNLHFLSILAQKEHIITRSAGSTHKKASTDLNFFRNGGQRVKEKILKMLKESAPAYISGEEIAGKLQTSRTSVWKNIKLLQSWVTMSRKFPPGTGWLKHRPSLPCRASEGLQTEIVARRPIIFIILRR